MAPLTRDLTGETPTRVASPSIVVRVAKLIPLIPQTKDPLLLLLQQLHRLQAQLADLKLVTGPGMIHDENGLLNGYVYVDMAGRDIGGYVAEVTFRIPEGIVKEAMAELLLEQREVVTLRFEAGMGFRQIARIQNASVNTVQGRYRYGMEKLRSCSTVR
jgi:hypothetical protein